MDMGFGRRLKALRENRNFTQDQVADMLGFAHRQTLATIEGGARQMSAADLTRATEVFGVPLSYFTDTFAVVGEARFSWRKRDNVGADEIDVFEGTVGRLFGGYRALSAALGYDCSRDGTTLPIGIDTPPGEAASVGEELSKSMQREDGGDDWLPEAVEDTYGIPVLKLDAPRSLSGAVCHLDDMDGIVVNRHDVPGRRNFDLAHELFHALTWASMPPEHIEAAADGPRKGRPNKVEILADSFANGLLMPSYLLEALSGWEALPDGEEALVEWVNAAANRLEVSSMAFVWRLGELGKISDVVRRALLRSARLRFNGAASAPPPPLSFGRIFVGILTEGMREGRISTRAAATLVGMDIDQMGDLCEAWGFERSPI